MKSILTGLVSGIALMGLAACGETDDTTTQGIEDGAQTEQPANDAAVPPADGDADDPAAAPTTDTVQ